MSVEALSIVLHHSRATGTAKLVLLGIANHAGDGGAWPSVATLARYANVHERNIQRAIDQLVALGELARHVQDGGLSHMKDHHRPNRYEVLVTCPATCDRTSSHRIRPLPTAQADLWTAGVALAPPGGAGATRGVADSSPGGVALAPPEPSYEPPTNLVPTASRTVTTGGTCSVCSLSAEECMRREATSGHGYTPRPRDPKAAVARVLEHYEDVAS